jgi:hypothetical protein
VDVCDEDGKLLRRSVWKPPPPDVAHWELPHATGERGEPPSSRCQHTATVVGDMMLVFGGLGVDAEGHDVALNDLHVLDLTTRTWSRPEARGQPPPPMFSHTATLVGKRLFIIGGQNGMEVFSSVYVFDTATGTWSCPIAKEINLAGHSATLVGTEIFVIVEGAVFVLDTETMAWSKPQPDASALLRRRVPTELLAHSAVAVGRRIFVFGGRVVAKALPPGSYPRCSSDLLVLDTETMQWSAPETRVDEVKAAPPPLDARAALLQARAAAAAGASANKYAGVPMPSPSLPRAEHAAALLRGRYMVIFGGLTTSPPKLNVVDVAYLSDVQVLDTVEMRWLSTPMQFVTTPPRALCSACVVADRGLLVWGGVNCAYRAMQQMALFHFGQLQFPAPTAASVLIQQATAGAQARQAAPPAPAPAPAPVPAAALAASPADATTERRARRQWERPVAARPGAFRPDQFESDQGDQGQ